MEKGLVGESGGLKIKKCEIYITNKSGMLEKAELKRRVLLYVHFTFIILQINLNLTNGNLINLSKFERVGDALLSRTPDMTKVKLNLTLGFNDIQVKI